MSKYHKIKWTDDDTKQLRRVVQNFNAKINRLAKKDPQNKNALPEKVTVRQLKELIKTRQDLKREINTLKRFSKRGAETLEVAPGNDYNTKITKWQRVEMNRRLAIVNRKRANRLKELEEIQLSNRGKPLGYKRGELGMGSVEANSLRPKKAFTPSMTGFEISRKWKSLLKESQSSYYDEADYRLRDNYIKALKENYHEDDIKEVIKKIESMDIKDFLDKFRSEDAPFEWAYPADLLQYYSYVDGVESMWGVESSNSETVKVNDWVMKKYDDLNLFNPVLKGDDLTGEVLEMLKQTKKK